MNMQVSADVNMQICGVMEIIERERVKSFCVSYSFIWDFLRVSSCDVINSLFGLRITRAPSCP